MSLVLGMLSGIALIVVPGIFLGMFARLPWMITVGVAPVLTYGLAGAMIVPFGALHIPWTLTSATLSLIIIAGFVAGICWIIHRWAGTEITTGPLVHRFPASSQILVVSGVVIGIVLIALAAIRGLPDWQSIPSTWDSAWHANEIRFIRDTGLASPTHMGQLRNVETHDVLFYPSAFHAIASLLCALTGAAPATSFTLSALAASVWLFPLSAALLTWHLLVGVKTSWKVALSASSAAILSAGFTSVPYVEFFTAAVPFLVSCGLIIPGFLLVVLTKDIPQCVPLALMGIIGTFSVHITGGAMLLMFVLLWWISALLTHQIPSRWGSIRMIITVIMGLLCLMPQLLCVRKQSTIIADHSYITHRGHLDSLRDALWLQTRHLKDFPIQYVLIGCAAIGGGIFLINRIWWPLMVWVIMVIEIMHTSAYFPGVSGKILTQFSVLFYNDPRRLSAIETLVMTPMAGVGLTSLILACWSCLIWAKTSKNFDRTVASPIISAGLILGFATLISAHYFPRHEFFFGNKYDSVMIDKADLDAFAYLATLPGAHDTLIGNANTDGTAWMYAVADLHPLWTHYDFPIQQGPGYQRFIIWAFADDADTDPRVARAVHALNIRYILVSTSIFPGCDMPDGLVSLDQSHSWKKIYDNGRATIFEWARQ